MTNIAEMLRTRVLATPDQAGLSYLDTHLTWREFYSQACSLSQRLADAGRYLRAEKLDRPEHVLVGQWPHRELDQESIVGEQFVLIEDLLHDGIRITHEVGALEPGFGVELRAGRWRPASQPKMSSTATISAT